jgi:hypothetical protein
MATKKAKKGTKENPATLEDIQNLNTRNYRIVEATLSDQFCNYKFEIIKGVGLGQIHGVTDKKNIVEDDLLEAFNKFRVHLAFIDNVFSHSGIDIDDIDKFHSHDLTTDYRVSGFKIKSKKGFETIQLIGEKHVPMGWESIDSPEISLDNLGGYTWYNELLTAANNAREEVALYGEGKCTPVKPPEEEKTNINQANLWDAEQTADAEMEDQLDKAKVD